MTSNDYAFLIVWAFYVWLMSVLYRHMHRRSLWLDLLRAACRARYGVRGGLKPPLAPAHHRMSVEGDVHEDPETSGWRFAWYEWRWLCWKCDSYLYDLSGLPDEWHAWMISKYAKPDTNPTDNPNTRSPCAVNPDDRKSS